MSGPAARTRSQVTSQGQADIQVSLPQEKQNDNKQPIQVNNNTTVLTTNDMIDRSHDAAAGSHKDKRKNNNKQGFSVEQALLGPSSSPSLTSNIALESQQTKADQSENPSQQQTKVTQSNVSAQQQINKPPETSQPNMASTTEGPEITDISMQDADHDSQGSTEEEILYYAKKQQTFSLFIGVKLSDKVNTSFATNFLKNTRDFLISDSNLGPGISQVSKIIPDFNKVAPGEGSRDNNNEANQDKPIKKKKDIIGYHLIINVTTKEIYESIMAVDFSCAEDTVSFAPYQSIRTQRKQTNEGTRGRTVQIYNASLEITTATLKPFLRRYGELEENGVYATRRNPYQPNKQIFYATYKESASADTFYGKPILWVYNEMLYITPMELSLDKREERRAFCAKLNGLPPNANAREYQDFIEEFNVLEFRIPRNTRTNRTQLYAYVYFKDEESMQRGTDRVIMRRNKQHEWSIPDMKSCFNCGYTSHLISDCDYRPPRNRPMNKKDYLNSVRRYQPGYRQREKQENARPGSYADAIRSRPNEARFENRKFQERYRQDNPYSNNKDRPWNRNNLRKRNDDNHNYGDDEQGMHEWDEEDDSFEDIPRSSSRASVLSRPRNAHYENVDRTPRNHRDDNEIQSIKQDLATLQDIVKTLAKSLEQTTNQISLYMQTTSSKGKEKVNEMNNNAMLIDQSGNTDNRQHQTPKRRLVSFNENNKRPQREDSSDSDSNDNRQNNMALLTAQLQELHKGMENITSSLTNINNRITTVDIARQVATLNIRQLNDIKAQNLAKYLDKNDIDILSITETRISNKNLKFITKNKFMNHQVFGTVGAKFNESGTLVIVKKELAKHISKLENYKG
ncbi:18860_t:CDS:2, partial [Rhizophagus irregularis]